MAKTNNSALLKKLKTALPTKLAKSTPLIVTQENGRAPKLSISLYHSDLKRLDQIKRYMTDHGARTVTDSQALRLAVRSIDLGEHLLDIYEAMQGEDGRRRAS